MAVGEKGGKLKPRPKRGGPKRGGGRATTQATFETGRPGGRRPKRGGSRKPTPRSTRRSFRKFSQRIRRRR